MKQRTNVNSPLTFQQRYLISPEAARRGLRILTAFQVLAWAGIFYRFLKLDRNQQNEFALPAVLVALVCLFVIGATTLHIAGQLKSNAIGGAMAVYVKLLMICHMLGVGTLYGLTTNPESDLYILAALCSPYGYVFLSRRDQLYMLVLMLMTTFVGGTLAYYLQNFELSPSTSPYRVVTFTSFLFNICLRCFAVVIATVPAGYIVDLTKKTFPLAGYQDALLRAAPEMYFVKNADFEFEFVSEEFAKWIGAQNSDEVIGTKDEQYFPESLVAKYREDDRKVLKGIGTSRVEGEEDNLKLSDPPTTRPRRCNFTKVPVVGSDGKVRGILGIVRDVTRENKKRQTLIRWFVHDFPKPLDAIYR